MDQLEPAKNNIQVTDLRFAIFDKLTAAESWPGESGQRGNWSFCLPAAKMAAEQERT
jgi:hypothetical protein